MPKPEIERTAAVLAPVERRSAPVTMPGAMPHMHRDYDNGDLHSNYNPNYNGDHYITHVHRNHNPDSKALQRRRRPIAVH